MRANSVWHGYNRHLMQDYGSIATAKDPGVDEGDFLFLDKVRFGYGERTILQDVSARFRRGSVTALMGGSGCGKTTLLRLIGGQLRPASGRVVFDGHDIPLLGRDELYALRRRMGMLFQFGALFTD